MKMCDVKPGELFQWNGSLWLMRTNGDANAIGGHALLNEQVIVNAASRKWFVKLAQKETKLDEITNFWYNHYIN